LTPRPIARASLLCLGLLGAGVPALAQDLGRGRGRLIQGEPANIERLVQRADLIVRGQVTRKEPRWINRVLHTDYELEVQETLKGPARKNVVVSVVGGTMGNVELRVPGAPTLQAGDQLVLFGATLARGAGFAPLGTFDGIVPIHPGRGNAGPTASPRGRPEPLTAFLDEVRALTKRP
jgi:hypothetical protein